MAKAHDLDTVLLTGGLGYIGRHLALELARAGIRVLTLDLKTPAPGVKQQPGETFIRGNCGDRALVESLLREQQVKVVLHLAASISMGESLADPLGYHENNVGNLIALLQSMDRAGVRDLVFTSSAGTYGDGDQVPLREDRPLRPGNPYGRTKVIGEGVLEDACRHGGFRAAALRLFNVAGLAPRAAVGVVPSSLKLIVPLLVQVALEQRELRADEAYAAGVFTQDYPTPDGTPLRDYVHPSDVSRAFIKAAEWLRRQGDSAWQIANVGTGNCISVRDMIAIAEAVTGHRFNVPWHARIPGFPTQTYPDVTRAREVFGFQATESSAEQIVRSAWQHHTS